MTVETFVTNYGYPAVFAGTLLEGESVVLIAGMMAHSGYIKLPIVILVAFIGAFTADQSFFHLGRIKGRSLLNNKPGWARRIDKIRSFLVRYHSLAIFSYRFLYGMRTITPIIIGASGFSAKRFLMLNFCSTLVWATITSSAGYLFGQIIAAVIADFRRYEVAVIISVAAVAFAIWLYRNRTKIS